MFRPQAQAETHSKAQGPLPASRTTQAETHSNRRGPPLSSRALCWNLFFFLFINRLQAQAQAHATAAADRVKLARFFIDSPQNIGYLKRINERIKKC